MTDSPLQGRPRPPKTPFPGPGGGFFAGAPGSRVASYQVRRRGLRLPTCPVGTEPPCHHPHRFALRIPLARTAAARASIAPPRGPRAVRDRQRSCSSRSRGRAGRRWPPGRALAPREADAGPRVVDQPPSPAGRWTRVRRHHGHRTRHERPRAPRRTAPRRPTLHPRSPSAIIRLASAGPSDWQRVDRRVHRAGRAFNTTSAT